MRLRGMNVAPIAPLVLPPAAARRAVVVTGRRMTGRPGAASRLTTTLRCPFSSWPLCWARFQYLMSFSDQPTNIVPRRLSLCSIPNQRAGNHHFTALPTAIRLHQQSASQPQVELRGLCRRCNGVRFMASRRESSPNPPGPEPFVGRSGRLAGMSLDQCPVALLLASRRPLALRGSQRSGVLDAESEPPIARIVSADQSCCGRICSFRCAASESDRLATWVIPKGSPTQALVDIKPLAPNGSVRPVAAGGAAAAAGPPALLTSICVHCPSTVAGNS